MSRAPASALPDEPGVLQWVTPVSAWALAVLLLFTGVDKALHFRGFVSALGSYALVPSAFARVVAPAVIIAEISVGSGLLVRRCRHSAAQVACGLLLAFSAALVSNMLWSPDAACGCWFSITLAESNAGHLIQNLLFLAVAVSVAWDTRPSSCDTHKTSAPPEES